MRLAEQAWPEVDRRAVLVVPLGSTEQHGPHLPLHTDTTIAVALAGLLAQQVPGTVVAPGMPYGSAGEHAAFPGTLSIGATALRMLLVELVRSACFARTVVVNAHGGNAEPLEAALSQLRAEGHDVLSWSPRLPDGDAHAGRVETALMLALRACDPSGAPLVAGNVEPLGTLMPALRAGQLREVTPTGVLGDPRGATAAEGQALLGRLGADLVAVVRAHWPGLAA